MTTIIQRPHDTIEQAQQERIERCAELGQVVAIDKDRCRKHYEGLVEETRRSEASSAAAR